MGDLIQFVDKIDANPTVLLDINDDAMWTTTLITVAPPLLRRATSNSMLADGDVDVATVRADRLVTFTIDLICPNQSTKAAELQKLARLIDRDGTWLRYRPTNAPHPVFLRLKRGDVAELLSNDVQVATLQGSVTVPADPWAYGLPVSGDLTVRHDVNVENAFGFTLSDVQGDARAPLRIFDGTGGGGDLGYIVSSVAADGISATGVALPQIASASSVSPWTRTTETDAAYIGGSAQRFTKPSGSSASTISPQASGSSFGTLVKFENAVPGDYRLFIRGHGSDTANRMNFKVALAPGGQRTILFGTTPRWIDAGIVRMPFGRRAGSPFEQAGNGLSELQLQLTIPGASGFINLEAFMAIPAGLDVGDSTFAASEPTLAGLRSIITLDDQWAVSVYGETIAYGGQLPQIIPGRANHIRYFGLNDARTKTRAVQWQYFPRYLLHRPASS